MSKVIITSDIRLYREGLSIALAMDPEIEVCAVAACFDEALNVVNTTSPDALLIDMAMPKAIQIIHAVVQAASQIKVIALGVSENPASILECAEAGVAGYVSRDGSVNDLTRAVASALRNEFICTPRVAAVLLQQVCALSSPTIEEEHINKLTPREREVVKLLAEGLSNKKIAQRLDISVSTAKNHVHNLLYKLKASHRSEVVAMLWDKGIPDPQRNTQAL